MSSKNRMRIGMGAPCDCSVSSHDALVNTSV
jgi:hypothetical protein